MKQTKKVTTKYEKPNKQNKYVLDKSGAESTKSLRNGGAQTFAKNSTLNKQVVYRLKQNKRKITKITKQFLEKKPFLDEAIQ